MFLLQQNSNVVPIVHCSKISALLCSKKSLCVWSFCGTLVVLWENLTYILLFQTVTYNETSILWKTGSRNRLEIDFIDLVIFEDPFSTRTISYSVRNCRLNLFGDTTLMLSSAPSISDVIKMYRTSYLHSGHSIRKVLCLIARCPLSQIKSISI